MRLMKWPRVDRSECALFISKKPANILHKPVEPGVIPLTASRTVGRQRSWPLPPPAFLSSILRPYNSLVHESTIVRFMCVCDCGGSGLTFPSALLPFDCHEIAIKIKPHGPMSPWPDGQRVIRLMIRIRRNTKYNLLIYRAANVSSHIDCVEDRP